MTQKEVDWRTDGTVKIFTNPAVTIRRPMLGEYKDLRGRWHTAEDEIDAIVNGEIASTDVDEDGETPIAVGALDEDATVEEQLQAVMATKREARAQTRTLNEKVLGVHVEWVRAMAEQMGDRALPADSDEWPMFVPTSEFVSSLFTHWRTVPLARSQR